MSIKKFQVLKNLATLGKILAQKPKNYEKPKSKEKESKTSEKTKQESPELMKKEKPKEEENILSLINKENYLFFIEKIEFKTIMGKNQICLSINNIQLTKQVYKRFFRKPNQRSMKQLKLKKTQSAISIKASNILRKVQKCKSVAHTDYECEGKYHFNQANDSDHEQKDVHEILQLGQIDLFQFKFQGIEGQIKDFKILLDYQEDSLSIIISQIQFNDGISLQPALTIVYRPSRRRSSIKFKMPNQQFDAACKITIKFKERKPDFICLKLKRIQMYFTEENIQGMLQVGQLMKTLTEKTNSKFKKFQEKYLIKHEHRDLCTSQDDIYQKDVFSKAFKNCEDGKKINIQLSFVGINILKNVEGQQNNLKRVNLLLKIELKNISLYQLKGEEFEEFKNDLMIQIQDVKVKPFDYEDGIVRKQKNFHDHICILIKKSFPMIYIKRWDFVFLNRVIKELLLFKKQITQNFNNKQIDGILNELKQHFQQEDYSLSAYFKKPKQKRKYTTTDPKTVLKLFLTDIGLEIPRDSFYKKQHIKITAQDIQITIKEVTGNIPLLSQSQIKSIKLQQNLDICEIKENQLRQVKKLRIDKVDIEIKKIKVAYEENDNYSYEENEESDSDESFDPDDSIECTKVNIEVISPKTKQGKNQAYGDKIIISANDADLDMDLSLLEILAETAESNDKEKSKLFKSKGKENNILNWTDIQFTMNNIEAQVDIKDSQKYEEKVKNGIQEFKIIDQ